MQRAMALIAGLSAVAATPLAAQDQAQAQSVPQEAMPSESSQPPAVPATPDAGMAGAMAGGAGNFAVGPGGPAYASQTYWQGVAQQQGTYIKQLEKHIAELDAYIAAHRPAGH